jgi:hypothetical protein
MSDPRRSLRRAVLAVAVALAAPLPGCIEPTQLGLLRGDPDAREVGAGDWVESGSPLTGVAYEALWDRAKSVIGAEGLAVDDSRTDYATQLIVTRWDTLLAPNRFEGYRHRVWIRFTQPAPEQWSVGVAVQKQNNADMDAPTNPANARWEDKPADVTRAGVLLWKIESGFRAPGQSVR